MKIGIVSDSHYKIDYLKECIELFESLDCEYLIHAGDICTLEALELLKNSRLKDISVFGNNDIELYGYINDFNIKQEPYHFKIEDKSFKLMHLPFHLSGDADIIIFGHTHKFYSEYINNKLFLNPGEVCAREEPKISCVILDINENEYIISHYFRKKDEEKFMKEEIRYEQ